MLLLEAPVLTGIVLGGVICSWSQIVMLYFRLNFEFFAYYKSMWHLDNYRYASDSLSITFTFSLVNHGLYICNYRVRETGYIVLNLLKKNAHCNELDWFSFLLFYFSFFGRGKGALFTRISNVNHTICQKKHNLVCSTIPQKTLVKLLWRNFSS